DGMNDCTMFRPEWFSIAMGNAKPQLKEKAKYITSRADEDGIYEACRRFGWI
ncbi:MAG: HAD hydrolase family protein, partial [Dialister sp.]|nr:HAD hydrolase family protein [Dialister sp.]MDY2621455.1 HAD hydrolase family protein [Dialister sp.]